MQSETNEMVNNLGISKTGLLIVSVISLAVGVPVLSPQTFFIGNFMNAIMIILITALSLKTGNYKIALIEIPFLLMPMVLIYQGIL